MNKDQIIFFLFIALFLPITVSAQTDSLLQYVKIAAENHPGVKADFLIYQAALQKIPQAGALQDPQLDLGFFLQPMEMMDGKQMADIKLMQMFPWFGTRKAARTEARHMAQMAFEQFRETRDQVFLDVYTQWFKLCLLQQQSANNRNNRKLLEQLKTLALRRFTTGSATPSTSGEKSMAKGEENSPATGNYMSGMNMNATFPPSALSSSPPMSQGNMGSMNNASSGMSDVLRIRLEIAETENNLENILSEIQAEKAKFNTLLNRPAESGLQIPDSLEKIPFPFDIETIKNQITLQNPMLNMLYEEQSAYQAKAEMDKKMSYPMFGIGLQYMLINKKAVNPGMETDMDGISNRGNTGSMGNMNGKDMIMPMASITIPIYRGKYKALQRENILLQQANKKKYINTQNLLEAELYRLKGNLDNADRKIALYRKQSELAKTTYRLIVNEFVSGKSDLSNVIQVQRQLLDYELKIAEAIADYNTMAANIQKLISSNEK
ncbi:MAG: TolC family protein [Dysgonamonadaceae bacterium]|nr:TolC family protein [Dysgonamonadaceae bacterium]